MSNANSNKYTVTRHDHRAHRGLGLDDCIFTKSVVVFIFFTLLGYITSVNNVVVTVLHLSQALHRRIL